MDEAKAIFLIFANSSHGAFGHLAFDEVRKVHDVGNFYSDGYVREPKHIIEIAEELERQATVTGCSKKCRGDNRSHRQNECGSCQQDSKQGIDSERPSILKKAIVFWSFLDGSSG
jgi:hypothetical protein